MASKGNEGGAFTVGVQQSTMTMRRGSGTVNAGGLGVDAASSAADAGGSLAAIDHDVAITAAALAACALGVRQLTAAAQANATVEAALTARALGINAPAAVSAKG